LEFIDFDSEKRTIELAFAATEAFTNPVGNVLGGFPAAMLYYTIGPALLATLRARSVSIDFELQCQTSSASLAGSHRGKGCVLRRDGDIAVVEAALFDAEGAVIATATATARVIPLSEAKTAV
jgi:acyl-coenzyme A thioesterase PaaI-like protein